MIRRANAADAEAILAIWNPIIRDTIITFNSVEKTVADITDLINQRPTFVVDQDGVLGFATYGPFRNGVGYRYVAEHTIVLAETAQGIGTGRALMTAICEDAKGAGITALWAGVSAENTSGVKFHAAIGFREIARLPEVGFKFGRTHDLVLMQKRL